MSHLRKLLFIIILLTLNIASQAQTDELIAYRNGDLVTWSLSNNIPEQITFWGYNGGGVLSPDGTTIAFLSYDDDVATAVANQEFFSEGDLPANIWVMDIVTREFDWINDQSAASPDRGVFRSPPVWSPDSTRLAWIELIEYPNVSLQVYDFRTDSITTVANNLNIGYQDAGTYLPRIDWGDGGISRILFNIVGDDFRGQNTLEVYNPDTGDVFSMTLDFLLPDDGGSLSQHWVNDNGRDVIAIQANRNWGIIDPNTGGYAPINGQPILQKVGDSSIQLIPVYSGSYSFDWYVAYNGQVSELDYTNYSIGLSSQPTISGDGSIVAWHNRGGVYIWDTGSQRTQKIIENDEGRNYDTPEPVNVVWSPMEWVLSDTPIIIAVRPPDTPTIVPPTQAPAPTQAPVTNTSSCKTSPFLYEGGYAILTPGQNNNVRQSWSTNSQILGEIFPGEVVYIHNGPVCSEGYNWYLVSNEFIYGWTAEGFGGVYWLVNY